MGVECCKENKCLRATSDSLQFIRELNKNYEKNEEIKSNERSIVLDGMLFSNNNNDTLILIIGNKNNKDVKKVLEHIDNHFYGKKKENIDNNTYKYIENNINYKITITLFENIKNYLNNKYNWIISFSEDTKEIIETINTFKKTNYMFKKVVDKNEILNKCNIDDIQENNILLTNHFRININNFFSWNNNDSISQSNISYSIDYSNEETLDDYKCPISKSVMEDPVITRYGHHYERKNIEEEIRKNGKSPKTKRSLKLSDLIPDEDMKIKISKIINKKI